MSGNEIAEVRFNYSDTPENYGTRELSINNNRDTALQESNREIDAVAQILPNGAQTNNSNILLGDNINEKNFLTHVAAQGLDQKKNTAKIQMGSRTFAGYALDGTLAGTIALDSSEEEKLKRSPQDLKSALVAPKREIYAFQTSVDDTRQELDIDVSSDDGPRDGVQRDGRGPGEPDVQRVRGDAGPGRRAGDGGRGGGSSQKRE